MKGFLSATTTHTSPPQMPLFETRVVPQRNMTWCLEMKNYLLSAAISEATSLQNVQKNIPLKWTSYTHVKQFGDSFSDYCAHPSSPLHFNIENEQEWAHRSCLVIVSTTYEMALWCSNWSRFEAKKHMHSWNTAQPGTYFYSLAKCCDAKQKEKIKTGKRDSLTLTCYAMHYSWYGTWENAKKHVRASCQH